jgi:hypothetical protein
MSVLAGQSHIFEIVRENRKWQYRKYTRNYYNAEGQSSLAARDLDIIYVKF